MRILFAHGDSDLEERWGGVWYMIRSVGQDCSEVRVERSTRCHVSWIAMRLRRASMAPPREVRASMWWAYIDPRSIPPVELEWSRQLCGFEGCW